MSEELLKIMRAEIQVAVKETVNGKIVALHDEIKKSNRLQDEKMAELLQVFKDTSAFFKVLVKIAQFLIPIGAVVGMVYGLFNWIRN